MDSAYADLPGVEYDAIEYDNYLFQKLGKGDVRTKVLNPDEKTKRCVFVQPKKDADGNIIKESRGIIPRILLDLLDARRNTRKRMAKEPDPFKRALLDAAQLAYKITANSVRIEGYFRNLFLGCRFLRFRCCLRFRGCLHWSILA